MFNQGTPFSGGNQGANPFSGGNQGGSPFSGGNQGTPFSGGNQGTPFSGGNQGTPFSGGNQGTPFSGGNQGTPFSGGNQGTPFSGFSNIEAEMARADAHMRNIMNNVMKPMDLPPGATFTPWGPGGPHNASPFSGGNASPFSGGNSGADPLKTLALSVPFSPLKPGFWASKRSELEGTLRELFNTHSKGNKLDFDGFALAFSDLQDKYRFSDLDHDKAQVVFNKLDRNRDGSLDFAEFSAAAERIIG